MFLLQRGQRFFLMLTGLSAATGSGLALEASDVLFYSKGPLSLRPQLHVTEMFSDNVFYQDENRDADFITTLSPGLNLMLGRGPGSNTLLFNYTFDYLNYLDNDHLNTTQHSFGFNTYLYGQRISLVGSDRIQFLSSPLGGSERVFNRENVDRTAFADNYRVTYELTQKTEVYLEGTYTATDYDKGLRLLDQSTWSATGGFGFKALPNTSFFGEVYYGQTTSEPNVSTMPENPRLDFVGGFLGARGNFTPRLTGMVKAGYEERMFEDDTPVSGAPVVEASLTQQIKEKTFVSLGYSRRTGVSVQFNSYSYTYDAVTLNVRQLLGSTGKWEANLGGLYQISSYEATGNRPERSDNPWNVNLNLAYRIQLWLTANLGYQFESFKSDGPGVIDYDVNRVTLRLAVGY